MSPARDAAFRWIVKEFIKKGMVVLGSSITLLKIKKIPGLFTGQDGSVQKMEGESRTILEVLLKEFIPLSPVLSKQVFDLIISASPDLKTALAEDYDKLNGLFLNSFQQNLESKGYISLSKDRQTSVNDPSALEETDTQKENVPQGNKNVSGSAFSVEKLDSGKVDEVGKIFEGLSQEEKVNDLN